MKQLKVLQPNDLFRFACPEDVRLMPESGNGHYCGSCEKVVLDLSKTTFDEAVSTIRGATKSTCVSYAVEGGGGLVFRDLLKGSKVVTVAAFLAACQTPATETKPAAAPSAEVAHSRVLERADPPNGSDEPNYPGAVEPAPVPVVSPPVYGEAANTGWPSAVAENPLDPPRTKPLRGRVAPPPKPPRVLAGKPAPPAMVTGEPMIPETRPMAGAPMPIPSYPVAGTVATPDDVY